MLGLKLNHVSKRGPWWWQVKDIDQNMNLQNTPHSSPLRVRYGKHFLSILENKCVICDNLTSWVIYVSVGILEKNDPIIKRFHWIYLERVMTWFFQFGEMQIKLWTHKWHFILCSHGWGTKWLLKNHLVIKKFNLFEMCQLVTHYIVFHCKNNGNQMHI